MPRRAAGLLASCCADRCSRRTLACHFFCRSCWQKVPEAVRVRIQSAPDSASRWDAVADAQTALRAGLNTNQLPQAIGAVQC